jgi:hypothetical protein
MRYRLVFVVADTHDLGTTSDQKRPIDSRSRSRRGWRRSRVPLSRLFPLHPLLRVAFTKWRYLDRAFFFGDTEPVFQTYEVPLEMFAAPGWHPARIRDVRFVFDRTPSGAIALAGVGFARSL